MTFLSNVIKFFYLFFITFCRLTRTQQRYQYNIIGSAVPRVRTIIIICDRRDRYGSLFGYIIMPLLSAGIVCISFVNMHLFLGVFFTIICAILLYIIYIYIYIVLWYLQGLKFSFTTFRHTYNTVYTIL